MATAIGNTYLTLLDWVKRVNPGGGIDEIIEVLAASNPIIADANVLEGNLPTGHRSTQRTSQPSGTWRLMNKGVVPTKSTTKQVDDTCGILEAYSKLDVDIALLNGNEAAFRASEDNAFVAGLNSTAATAIFYGNSGTSPESMHGLTPRYNSLATTHEYADQIINASGAGSDNTSIWLVTWGPQTCSLIYPKGSMAGLQIKDLGKVLVEDGETIPGMYEAYVTKFQWKLGLMLKDYRYVTRICNIDVSDLTDDAASGADIMRKMLAAMYTRPTVDLGNMAKSFFYCNKTIAEYLHVQSQNKSNVQLTVDNPAGKPIVSFLGVPIHVCDNLDVDEDAVTA